MRKFCIQMLTLIEFLCRQNYRSNAIASAIPIEINIIYHLLCINGRHTTKCHRKPATCRAHCTVHIHTSTSQRIDKFRIQRSTFAFVWIVEYVDVDCRRNQFTKKKKKWNLRKFICRVFHEFLHRSRSPQTDKILANNVAIYVQIGMLSRERSHLFILYV